MHGNNNTNERGSVMVYVMIAIFLMGVLILSATGGPKKNIQTQQLDEAGYAFEADIATIESAVAECALNWSTPVDLDSDGDADATDNPNAPYPVYNDLSSGGTTGETLTDIVCPGNPSHPLVFSSANVEKAFQAFDDTTLYTVTYLNNATEGVMIRVERSSANALWDESLSRLNNKYSTCKAAISTTETGCANNCLFYWVKRLPTSAIAVEAGCP